MRLDKWLAVTRIYKKRSAAHDALAKGWIVLNGQVAKANRMIQVGDHLEIQDMLRLQQLGVSRAVLLVAGLSERFLPPALAQELYRWAEYLPVEPLAEAPLEALSQQVERANRQAWRRFAHNDKRAQRKMRTQKYGSP